jgi:hypothetical protein
VSILERNPSLRSPILFQVRRRHLRAYPQVSTGLFDQFSFVISFAAQDESYDLLAGGTLDGTDEQILGTDSMLEDKMGDGEGVAQVNGVDHDHDHDMADVGAEETTAAPPSAQLGERQPNKVRITTPYLTKYERARILGTRALQIRCVGLAFYLADYSDWRFQHERSRACAFGRRDRCASNRNKRTFATKNTARHTTIPA